MLLQRLLRSEPDLEMAIAYNLVDLALASDVELLGDIIKTYSRLSLAGLATGAVENDGPERHHAVSLVPTVLVMLSSCLTYGSIDRRCPDQIGP